MINLRWVPAKEDEESAVITIKPGTGHMEEGEPAMQPQVLKLQFQRELHGEWYTVRIEE